MESFIMIVIWAFSVPICVKKAGKIGSNRLVAFLAAIAVPILAPLVYMTLASNPKYKK